MAQPSEKLFLDNATPSNKAARTQKTSQREPQTLEHPRRAVKIARRPKEMKCVNFQLASMPPNEKTAASHRPDWLANASTTHPSFLPNSVRNAPTEMRSAIRRKQNNESSRRSRARKKMKDTYMREVAEKNADRIAQLERQVNELERTLKEKKKLQTGMEKKESQLHQCDAAKLHSSGEYFERGDPKFFGDAF